MGVDNLLEMLTTAEVSESGRPTPTAPPRELLSSARSLDKGWGPVATLLVQNGTLKQGDIIIAGTSVGRVRAMVGEKGQKITSAGPSVPVEITGLSETPSAGATFNAVADEKLARELVEQRKAEEKAKANAPVTKVSLEDLFSQIQAGEMKNLNIIVKADVQGSVEAVKASLEKLSNDEVRVRVIHGGVGAINESDVMLASTSQAIIVGFNVRPDNAARDSAARAHVDMRMYRVIYDAINEIESAMKGMLAPKFREALLGHAEVRQTYKVSGAPWPAATCRTASSSGRTARSAWSGTASSSTRAFWPLCSGSRTRRAKWPQAMSAACPSRSSTISKKAILLKPSLWRKSPSNGISCPERRPARSPAQPLRPHAQPKCFMKQKSLLWRNSPAKEGYRPPL